MKIPVYIVNTFTNQRFSGNPAAICLLRDWLPARDMQNIATENRINETAFLVRLEDGFGIRWFTTKTEVEQSGHGTLASAYVLSRYKNVSAENIEFKAKNFNVSVKTDGDWYYMEYPTDDLAASSAPRHLWDGLGATSKEVYRGWKDYLVVFEKASDIAGLRPDMRELSQVASRGIIVTAPGDGDDGVDFVSRFFAPQYDLPEDPVSGSGHSSLVVYWSHRLGKKQMNCRQLSPRGGELICRKIDGAVEVGGQATTYMIGEIFF